MLTSRCYLCGVNFLSKISSTYFHLTAFHLQKKNSTGFIFVFTVGKSRWRYLQAIPWVWLWTTSGLLDSWVGRLRLVPLVDGGLLSTEERKARI